MGIRLVETSNGPIHCRRALAYGAGTSQLGKIEMSRRRVCPAGPRLYVWRTSPQEQRLLRGAAVCSPGLEGNRIQC